MARGSPGVFLFVFADTAGEGTIAAWSAMGRAKGAANAVPKAAEGGTGTGLETCPPSAAL